MPYLLYAEDDFDDQQDFRDLIRGIDPDIKVVFVHTGLALVQYLDTLGPHEEWPFMLVLDMNMPVWDGIRTLHELKESPRYTHLPVIFYSTSSAPQDATAALDNGATAFILKPVRRDELPRVAGEWEKYCHALLQSRKQQ